MHILFAQTLVLDLIPLYLLAFGILYVVLGYLLHPVGAHLALPVAAVAIAASLAWFFVKGAATGGMFLSSDVTAILGIGIVAVVLAKVFAGH